MKTFLNDLKNELIKNKVDMEEIAEIIHDHEEMIATAMAEGLTEEEIPARFGDPKILARELAEQSRKQTNPIEKDGYTLWKSFTPDEKTLHVFIQVVAENVAVQPSEDDDIHVYYQGKGKVDRYEISYHKGTFKLEAPKTLGLLFMRSSSDDLDFLVEFPQSLDIQEIKQHGVSSDVKYQNLKSEKLIINTTSGDLSIQTSQFTYVKVNTVSGDLLFTDVKMGDLDASQVSGDLKIERSKIEGNIHSSTVSGDIEINDTEANDVEFSAVSGDVNGCEFYPKTIKFKSVSGDMNLTNKESREIKVIKNSSLSGSINIHS